MSKQDALANTIWTLTVQPHGWACETVAELSLLEAALLEGIRIPNSCRNGTCRTCICKMLAGKINYKIDWPGLSLEEKQEGWILPCVAQARSDVVLDVPAATTVFNKEI
ncbi:2Fe-2S iron-sulfur cluster binding domain-containing protein [Undibacterium sp.]|uniref:2Fe-2S iron-sulfur cluster-binding protein n=1 Tax=Undibacterium sp. TaxID=1914977 RepID=UPI00272F3360|nr:2Fe-2S iron-sulfur cluster binding domain-containing protein [Undibacterium sp.]MDP1979673.1 2Fe-2S iron-sulfur cluster binding domain-containing protein [Undibacterium sp.]